MFVDLSDLRAVLCPISIFHLIAKAVLKTEIVLGVILVDSP